MQDDNYIWHPAKDCIYKQKEEAGKVSFDSYIHVHGDTGRNHDPQTQQKPPNSSDLIKN